MSTDAVSAPPPALCHNCLAELNGHFCHRCGQPDRPLDPTFRDLWHEFIHEFLHIDGKILQTLKFLLLCPGYLTAEFLAGRRARYIGPFRLYLTISIVFFFLSTHVPGKQENLANGGQSLQVGGVHISSTPEDDATAKKVTDSMAAKVGTQSATPNAAKTDADKNADKDNDDDIDAQVEAQVAAAKKDAMQKATQHGAFHDFIKNSAEDAMANPEEFRHRLNEQISHTMFVMLPLFALILKRIYRKSGKHYPSCLYFSIHFHSLFFLLLSFTALLQIVTFGHIQIPGGIIMLLAAIYLFFALRKVFEGTIKQTLWRMTKIAVIYLPCLLLGLGSAATSALLLHK